MSRTHILASYLRDEARRRLDRVEGKDEGRNARSALALLDASSYVAALAEDDPLVAALVDAGCFGLDGVDAFDPGDEARRVIRNWHFEEVGGEPWELVMITASLAHRNLMPMSADSPAST